MTQPQDNQRHKIRKILEISSLINSSLELCEVLDNALAAVEQFIQVETSSIFELDAAGGELFFACARGAAADKLHNRRLKVGEGIAGYVAQCEQPLMVTDAHRDPRFAAAFDDLTGFTTRAILCVPLKVKERLVGVLELLNKRDGTDFSEEDLEIVTILANQIGIALENARLYKKLEEKLLLTVEELKFTQSRLLQSERLAALGKLAQGVAHEVRNPAAIIGGLARLIRKKLPAEDPNQETLEQIMAAASRLEMMVKEVESFARLPAVQPTPAEIAGILEASLAPFRPQCLAQGVAVEVEVPSKLPLVPVDAHLLGLALQHLIRNALEAMPTGGKLTLTVHLEAQFLRLTCQDSGCGIPADILPLIFDPFFSTKPQAVGMGLTIAHRIIAEHRGELRLASTPGLGTTVEVWLPRWPSE